ncbi:hypothetical protein ACLIA0_10915 [Bacillaceae bacterium W0354]
MAGNCSKLAGNHPKLAGNLSKLAGKITAAFEQEGFLKDFNKKEGNYRNNIEIK